MLPLITVFFADTPITLEVIVAPSPSTSAAGPELLELFVNQSGGAPRLEARRRQTLDFSASVANVLSLPPGVYFFATDSQIKYSITSGGCRVALQSGKDPWPPPPPPAPQGTDLKMWEAIYKEMFSDVVISVSATAVKPWVVVSVEEELLAS
jgi:hypothetical protein